MRLESRWFRTSKIKEELSQARTGSEGLVGPIGELSETGYSKPVLYPDIRLEYVREGAKG
jgi:hypothetical protein